jgi:hypothetical protein
MIMCIALATFTFLHYQSEDKTKYKENINSI